MLSNKIQTELNILILADRWATFYTLLQTFSNSGYPARDIKTSFSQGNNLAYDEIWE